MARFAAGAQAARRASRMTMGSKPERAQLAQNRADFDTVRIAKRLQDNDFLPFNPPKCLL